MRVILRRTDNGRFYAGPDNWTEDAAAACFFDGPDCALDRVAEARLEQVELLMHFDNPAFDLPLTIVGLGR